MAWEGEGNAIGEGARGTAAASSRVSLTPSGPVCLIVATSLPSDGEVLLCGLCSVAAGSASS